MTKKQLEAIGASFESAAGKAQSALTIDSRLNDPAVHAAILLLVAFAGAARSAANVSEG